MGPFRGKFAPIRSVPSPSGPSWNMFGHTPGHELQSTRSPQSPHSYKPNSHAWRDRAVARARGKVYSPDSEGCYTTSGWSLDGSSGELQPPASLDGNLDYSFPNGNGSRPYFRKVLVEAALRGSRFSRLLSSAWSFIPGPTMIHPVCNALHVFSGNGMDSPH